METNLIALLSAIFIAFLGIGVKSIYRNRLRNRHQLNIRPGIFRLYKQEHIYTTHSERKRNFMLLSNVITIVLFICIVVSGISLMVMLSSWMSSFLE